MNETDSGSLSVEFTTGELAGAPTSKGATAADDPADPSQGACGEAVTLDVSVPSSGLAGLVVLALAIAVAGLTLSRRVARA